MKLNGLLLLLICFAHGAKAENHGINQNFNFQIADTSVYVEKNQSKARVIFLGNFYLAPQNWSNLHTTGSQLGFGLGGMVGLGLQVDNLVLGLGPHFSINRWEADFFKSQTQNSFIDLYDMGVEGVFYMLSGRNRISVNFGTGISQFDSGYTSGGNPNINEGFNKTEGNYTNIGIGIGFGKLNIAPTYVMYSGAAKDASRLELRIGISF